MLSHAYFEALRPLWYPNQHWGRGKRHKCFKIFDEYCSWQSCPWSLKLMTSQVVEGTWIRTGGYRRFRANGLKVNDFLNPKQLCYIGGPFYWIRAYLFFFLFLTLSWGLLHSGSSFINLANHADFPRGSSRVVEDCMTSQKSVCMGGCYKLLSDFLLIFAFRQDEENSAEREQTMLFKIKET